MPSVMNTGGLYVSQSVLYGCFEWCNCLKQRSYPAVAGSRDSAHI